MRARRYGRIVNLSSRGALGRAGRTSYGAAKAGIVGMTRTWALELAAARRSPPMWSPPGPTATEMFRKNNLSGPDAEEKRQAFLADVPMGRFGEPEEVAFAIATFLDRRAGVHHRPAPARLRRLVGGRRRRSEARSRAALTAICVTC